jgi:hypothetical protein
MEAFSALLGAIIGGAITVFVTYINNKKELEVKQLEFKLKEEALKASNISEFRKEQILRYSKFSGSLQFILGNLDDIIDIIQQDRELSERKKAIGNITKDSDYQEAIKNLNSEMSWISIVSDSNKVFEGLCELEEKFDEFMSDLGKIYSKEIIEEEIETIINSFDQVKKLQRQTIKLLQEDIKRSIQ